MEFEHFKELCFSSGAQQKSIKAADVYKAANWNMLCAKAILFCMCPFFLIVPSVSFIHHSLTHLQREVQMYYDVWQVQRL